MAASRAIILALCSVRWCQFAATKATCQDDQVCHLQADPNSAAGQVLLQTDAQRTALVADTSRAPGDKAAAGNDDSSASNAGGDAAAGDNADAAAADNADAGADNAAAGGADAANGADNAAGNTAAGGADNTAAAGAAGQGNADAGNAQQAAAGGANAQTTTGSAANAQTAAAGGANVQQPAAGAGTATQTQQPATTAPSVPQAGETPVAGAAVAATAAANIPPNGEAEHYWDSTWHWAPANHHVEQRVAPVGQTMPQTMPAVGEVGQPIHSVHPVVESAPLVEAPRVVQQVQTTAPPVVHTTAAPVVQTSAAPVVQVESHQGAHPQDGEGIGQVLQADRSAGPAGRTAVSIVLEVDTMLLDYADTNTGVSAAFKVNGIWSQEVLFCNKASYGEVLRMPANLSSWPSQIKLKALGPDAFGYSSIKLHWGSISITILGADAGKLEYGHDSPHWIDGNEAAPISSIYDIPEVHWQPQVVLDAAVVNCTTQEEERAYAFGYTTAPVGSPCVFGVDVRDEGSHCILDEGQYGSYGWCYTAEDGSSWGSCSKDCPLTGQLKVLGDKIESVREFAANAMLGPH